mmetsp:Transcript_9479/g.12903  ORF Transcript_9479/g.12903 Transcript_9479/m.12903 type:complete len:131 (+) Transcript_9479:3-395(+)
MVDNEGLARVAERIDGQPIEADYFKRVNAQLAQHVSSLTARRRFGGQGSQNFGEMIATLKNFPMIKFFVAASGNLPLVETRSSPVSLEQQSINAFKGGSWLFNVDYMNSDEAEPEGRLAFKVGGCMFFYT